MRPSFSSQTSPVPDNLVAGDFPRVTDEVTILTGEGVLARGTVLGKVTASGKYRKSASASADGSQTPNRILAEDVDATAADVVTTSYLTGEFNERALVLGTGHTIASIKDGLRALGIFIKKSVLK